MAERDNIDSPPVKLVKIIIRSPVLISVAVFIVMSAIVIGLSFKHYDLPFGNNVLVEAHGMLFDILIIGVLILFLNRLAEKRITNKKYLDEIDDFRVWKSEEAAHRIAGNIKRLNRDGFKGRINLSSCFLKSADLSEVNLQDARLEFANLQNAYLDIINLQGARLFQTNLEGASLWTANLYKADLHEANLKGAIFLNANLREACLSEANLEKAYFKDANLEGAKGLTIEQLSKVETLYAAELDPELMEQVKEKYPHLLEEPKWEESELDE